MITFLHLALLGALLLVGVLFVLYVDACATARRERNLRTQLFELAETQDKALHALRDIIDRSGLGAEHAHKN